MEQELDELWGGGEEVDVVGLHVVEEAELGVRPQDAGILQGRCQRTRLDERHMVVRRVVHEIHVRREPVHVSDWGDRVDE